MQKTITLIGYYGAGNLGDELLLESSINIIKSIDSNVQINIFSQNPKLTSETYSTYQCFNKFNILDIYSALISSQTLVFGGGSIFQDSSSFKSLIYYCSIALLFKCCGKKLILLGQGIGPLKNSISEILCKIIYKAADFVNVRDHKSFEITRTWRLDDKKTLSGIDLVWFLNDINDQNNKSNTHLNIPANTLEDTLANTQTNTIMISLRDTREFQQNQLLSFVQHLKLNHSDCKFTLFAFQKTDLNILSKLGQYLNEYKLNNSICEISSLKDWHYEGKKLFLNSKIIYSMRFHGVMLAAKMKIPCVGLSYDPKVSSLCKEMNMPCLLLNNEFQEQLETLKFDKNQSHSNVDIEGHSNNLKRYLEKII